VVVPAEAPTAKPGEATPPVVKNEAPPAPAAAAGAVPPGSIIITKGTNVAAAPAGPPALSPALAEVVRLLEANVGQDVVMAYITNSTLPFNIGANEIVYLHDLGMPPTLITTLINIDSSPEMVARKKEAIAVKPLPPGVALSEPATNVYSPKGTFAVANPPEPEPVGADAGVVYPPAPTADVAYDVAPPVTEVNNSYFYTSLAPYGTWCDVAGVGYCWRPTCATWNDSWRPYGDGGRWLWSNSGWYWYSDYSWGWAPFHYGRWCRPAGYGWCWVPDNCWGPSWVSWRYSPNYCGWAPLPPTACYTTGFGFSYQSAHVGIGFEFGLGAADYCYVPSSRFCDRRPCDYFVSHQQHYAVHKETTVVNNYVVGNNNTVVNNGVGFDRVAKVTRGDIKQVALRDTTSLKNLGTRHDRLEADGKTLTVYRPPATTLTHKSVVSAPRNSGSTGGGSTGSTVVRPANYVKPTPASGSIAGKDAFSEPAPARVPTSHASPPANIYIGNPNKARTVPTPVTVYTKPVDSSYPPVIVTGGSSPPVQYSKPAAAPASDIEPAQVAPKHNVKSTAQGLATAPGLANAPGLSSKPGVASRVAPQDTDSPLKGLHQSPGSGYTKPAPGNSSARVNATKAPENVSAPGVVSAPRSVQPSAAVASQAPAARPGQGVSGPPPSAPAQNYSRPAPSVPAQGQSRPAPTYSAPARVESHQSRVAPPSAAPSAPSSAPRVSAPSAPSAPSGGGGGGGSSGKSVGGGGKSGR
jgi:hypothetical protein